MTSEEIQALYNELVPMPVQAAADGLAPVAAQQMSHGVLANNMAHGVSGEIHTQINDLPTNAVNITKTIPEVVDGTIQTPTSSPVAVPNYNYDRLVRPVVDTQVATLVAQGKQQVLNQRIKEVMEQAQSEYENAKKNYARRMAQAQARAAQAQAMAQGQGAGNGSVNVTETPGLEQRQLFYEWADPNDPYLSGGTNTANKTYTLKSGQQLYWHDFPPGVTYDQVGKDGRIHKGTGMWVDYSQEGRAAAEAKFGADANPEHGL